MTHLTPEMEIRDYAPRVLAGTVERQPRRPIRNAVIAATLCTAAGFVAGFVAGYVLGFEAGVNSRDTWEIYVPNTQPEPKAVPEGEMYV